jgi:hypothetical protein
VEKKHSSRPFKVSIQRAVLNVCKAKPRVEPSAKQHCLSAENAKSLAEVGAVIKYDLPELINLAGESTGIARRAVGAARQVIRPGNLTSKQIRYTYEKAFTPSRANIIDTAKDGALSVALGAAAVGFDNYSNFRRGEISGANYAGRIAYGAVKGAASFAAGAAAAPLGAALGAALPPLGGALGGSAIGYQLGKALGGDKAGKACAVAGAVIGAAAGFIPGVGPALGAIGANMWAGEASDSVLDRFIGEDRAGHAADSVAHAAGQAVSGIKNFFKW